MIPQCLAVAIEAKFILTPGSIAMLVALVFCIAVVWKWARRRI